MGDNGSECGGEASIIASVRGETLHLLEHPIFLKKTTLFLGW